MTSKRKGDNANDENENDSRVISTKRQKRQHLTVCAQDDCKAVPRYGYKGGSKTHCVLHKAALMADLKSKLCKHADCITRACFADEGKSARFCRSHKEDGMIDVRNRQCGANGCNKQPVYGLFTDAQPTYCVKHKLDGMADIQNRRCEADTCTTQPRYGFTTDARPAYCVKHKVEGMEDICSLRCLTDDCKTRPVYGLLTDKRPSYCVKHKLEAMEDICSLRCLADDCKTRPVYGLLVDKRPTYCVKHKVEGMEDICNLQCLTDDCKIQPVYGLVTDKRPTYCFKHKLSDMINSRDKCKTEGCVVKACFNFPGKPAVNCNLHKQDNMVDVRSTRCASGSCSVYEKHERARAQFKVHGQYICTSCCQRQYPEISKRGVQMRTELLVIAEIERLVPELDTATTAIWDCPPNCDTRLAPDRVWIFEMDTKTVSIHFELDETGARHEDDDHRAAAIQASIGSNEFWLVRFNPGVSTDGRPACVVRKERFNGEKYYTRADGKEWEHRMQILSDTIRHVYNCIHKGITPTEQTWKTKLFF